MVTVYNSLKNKNIVITGGASGIGESIVKAFYSQLSNVFFLDKDIKKGKELEKKLKKLKNKNKIRFLNCDLTSVDSIKLAFNKIEEICGNIDVLCNNAGNDERHSWEDLTSEMWDNCINDNLKHHYFCSQIGAKLMLPEKGGSIIYIGSISYLNGTTAMPAYTTAKSGLVGLLKTMSKILGMLNIRVNMIQPGWILTEKQLEKWIDGSSKETIIREQNLKNFLYPQDVAKSVLFFASNESAMITNQIINVDGGWI